MAKVEFPLGGVYSLLEPGPVVLLTTSQAGKANVMTLSWHTMLEFEPPTLGCVVSRRNFSFAALDATGECVISMPTAQIGDAVTGCGNCSGRDTDKFAAFGLTPVPASRVQAPLLAQCFASLECRVVDRTLVPRYELFVLEVLAAWVDPALPRDPTLHHRGYGVFMLAGDAIRLPSKMR